jgi:7,8-dihydropterin-6-yl-methyl-4-(beta-D-ribofuranosyl)aminobenzene 5'-phosphate synthase
MEIKVLMEDTACDGFACEHGLSLYVSCQGKKYLIDTGKTGLFADNAQKLGVSLSDIDAVFLSHAHYDHSGGFPDFFAQNKRAKVYLQKSILQRECYKMAQNQKKYIGIPRGITEQYADRFVYLDGFYHFENSIFLLPHHTKGLEKRGERAKLYVAVRKNKIADDRIENMSDCCSSQMADGFYGKSETIDSLPDSWQWKPDDFVHEQSVIFVEKDGLVVFNSCSHAGVENIIDEVNKAFPQQTIKAFVGGFHMMGGRGINSSCFSESEVKSVAKKLLQSKHTVYYSGHCTGIPSFEWLKEILGENLISLHAGLEIIL